MRLTDDLIGDLRYGIRFYRKNPGFATVIVLSFAVGLGAVTAVFSIIDALWFRPLPVAHPERLVWFESLTPVERRWDFSNAGFERFRSLTEEFEGVTAVCNQDRSNISVDGQSDGAQVRIGIVAGNYFEVVGLGTAIGRPLTATDDDAIRGHSATVISDDYWRRRFRRDPNVLGRTLSLNGTVFTIVGVAPPRFHGEWIGRPTDMWMPLSMLPAILPELPPGGDPRSRGMRFQILARLKGERPVAHAEAIAEGTYQQLLMERDRGNPSAAAQIKQTRLRLNSAATGFSPSREVFAPPLAMLSGLAALVLLTACANVTGLVGLRLTTRRQEMAVRLATGAGTGRIVRQIITEIGMVGAAGGLFGLLLARFAADIFVGFARLSTPQMGGVVSPDPIYLEAPFEPRVLVCAAAIGVASILGVALVPAWRMSRVPLGRDLNERGSARSSRRLSAGRLLVGLQVVLSCALLTTAGLFVRTVRNLTSQDFGVDRDRVLLVWTSLRQSGHIGANALPIFDRVPGSIATVPGVVSAVPAVAGLLNGSPSRGPEIKVADHPERSREDLRAGSDLVGPGYFGTIGMRMIAGREFTTLDEQDKTPVVIINDVIARRFFPGENPVGKRIGFGSTSEMRSILGGPLTGSDFEIVGVVSDAGYESAHQRQRLMYYRPYRQALTRLVGMCIAVRVTGPATEIAPRIRAALRASEPTLPILRIETIDEHLADALAQERIVALLSSGFGAVAVLLVSVGLFGLVAHSVARRVPEIGIRVALGATPRSILKMIVVDGMSVVGAGLLAAYPAAMWMGHLAASRLFGVAPTDAGVLAESFSLLLAVTLVAVWLPARRAARIDPIDAIRLG